MSGNRKSKSRKYCSVYGCRSIRGVDGLSFYSLPADLERRKKWLELVGREDLLNKNARSYEVCALHFPPAMFTVKRFLTPDATPLLQLPSFDDKGEFIKTDDTNADVDTIIKAEDPLNVEARENATQTDDSIVQNTILVVNKRSKSTQTEGMTVSEREKKLFDMLRQSEKKRRQLEEEIKELRKRVKGDSDSEESSEENDDDSDI